MATKKRDFKFEESDKPLTPTERAHAISMVEKVADRTSPGFVVATVADDEGYASSRFFGNNISKGHVIQVVMEHLGLSPEDMVMAIVAIQKAKDDTKKKKK